MESKNLFLFVFIFLINIKILVYSQDPEYGYILVTYESQFTSQPLDSETSEYSITYSSQGCNISITNKEINFNHFFTRVNEHKKIKLLNSQI